MTTQNFNTDTLAAVAAALPGDALAPARVAAAKRFTAAGFPQTSEENWKYTDLSNAAELTRNWLERAAAERPVVPEGANDDLPITEQIDAHWIVVSGGTITHLPETLTDHSHITVARLSECGVAEQANPAPLLDLNTSLLLDGLRISVGSAATVDKPIGLVTLDALSGAVTQTRVILDVGENAAVQVLESLHSVGSQQGFSNAVLEIDQKRGSKLDLVRLQSRANSHSGVLRLSARLGQDATLRYFGLDLGGALTRNDIDVDINASGATATICGLALTSDTQHVDNHVTVNHNQGPAQSNEAFRGIAAGRSRIVFNGKVTVAEGADGTDSMQSSHNLLLSDKAEIDTKPELEIYADDVKCAHGATVGNLDAKALYYLRTRGLDSLEARRVLTRAFAAQVSADLSIDAARDYVDAMIDVRLQRLAEEMA